MLFCGSFSSQVKREIKYRAKQLSELSGENSRPLVCAHLKHQGGRPEGIFDYARNGRLVTDIEHLVHHELFLEIPRLIGLSRKQNDRTIEGLFENVIDHLPHRGRSRVYHSDILKGLSYLVMVNREYHAGFFPGQERS